MPVRDKAAGIAVAASVVMITVALAAAGPAFGAFGDNFGIAPINGTPGGTTDTSVAFTDATGYDDHAFWAGACDRLAAPAPPAGAGDPPSPIPGGIGGIPPRQLVPASYSDPLFGTESQTPVLVASPPVPEHCIDAGVPSFYKIASTLWRASPAANTAPGFGPQASPCGSSFVPCWRLAPVVKAGGHPDGSTAMVMARGANNRTDGSPDNIRVDLPPGFVGNPSAVPECAGEQFAARPLACPPETQIGVIRLQVEGVGVQCEGGNWCNSDDVIVPVFNVEPRQGNVAEIGFGHVGDGGLVTVRLVAKARTNGDYGVTAFAGQIPAALALVSQTITLWGVPWAAHNDVWRVRPGHFRSSEPGSPLNCRAQPVPAPLQAKSQNIPPSGLVPACRALYDPSWGATAGERAIKPFFSNETDCNPSPVVRAVLDSYQRPGPFTSEGDPILSGHPDSGNWKTYDSVSPPVTDCQSLGFAPDITFEPTSNAADGASGLGVALSIPQNNDPKTAGGAVLDPPAPGAGAGEVAAYVQAATDYWRSDRGRAVAHLRDTVVTLPGGVSVNPSAAAGLEGCGDGQVGVRGNDGVRTLFNNGDPFNKDGGADGAECPDGSKIGTVQVRTPLLDEPLAGEVVLGEPKSTDPTSGEMFRLFLVVRNPARGLVAKIYGSSKADPATGQLTTRFANNPEIPFDRLDLDIRGGQRGVLALPARCASAGWSSAFAPWSGGAEVGDSGAFAIDANCGFGFAPSLRAGMDSRAARGSGTFEFTFARGEGQQYLRGLTASLPPGLLASVKGVPLCSNAAADAGACPAASKIGVVDAKAGSGDPFVLEEKGEVFLTEGYKGGAYGLAVKVRPVAGPFRGNMELSPIIVRQAIHVDRTTAQVTAISDPFPLIHHGVPLRVREVTVLVNRGGFMLNPSDCEAKQVGATLTSDHGTASALASPFRVADCASLAFRPKLTLALTGRKQTKTGKHPGVRAQVTQQGIGEAGIQQAVVRLPKSLALDVDNAQALCEFADGTKPDLENHCPKGSIVGRARAVTPLLQRPLAGNVYFVKNVRKDPRTGNTIRTLPMIIVALRGEIAINLKGESNTTKAGKLVNTFASVPDAPVSQFNLNINGGKNGILAVTRTRRSTINLCAGRHIAEADIDGHNGRRYDRDIRMKTPCTKRQTRAAKRNAQRATAKRPTAKRPNAQRPASP